VEDLFPGFTEDDRLGVVVRRDYGAVGASTLILSAVTAFYDRQRATGEDFFIYAEYFMLHVAKLRGDHNMLDIFRANKEFVVADDPEEILRAINDRAITRLIVEEGVPSQPAKRRLRSAIAYSASGRVESPDVVIAGSELTESFVGSVLEPVGLVNQLEAVGHPETENLRKRLGEVPTEHGARVRQARLALLEDARPVETFRRIGIDEALGLLVPR
jgi:hypothetical protein